MKQTSFVINAIVQRTSSSSKKNVVKYMEKSHSRDRQREREWKERKSNTTSHTVHISMEYTVSNDRQQTKKNCCTDYIINS